MKKIFDLYREKRIQIISALKVFTLFGLLKSLVYFAPLIMSQIITENNYGKFEYSLNLGQMLMGFISVGFSGAYAYFITKQNKHELKSVFHFHFLLLVGLTVLTTLIFPSLLNNALFSGIIIGLMLANQLIISTIKKLEGKNLQSITIDSILYILLALYLAYIYLSNSPFIFELWNVLLLLTLLLNAFFYHFKKIDFSELFIPKYFVKVYSFGALMLIAAPLVALNTASTRIFIEHFFDLEAVGKFSFYFRITSFTLIIYRVVTILIFRRIFTHDFKTLDKYYWKISLFVVTTNLLILLILPIFLDEFLTNFDKNTPYNYTLLFISCGFHVIFWINTAMMEPIFQRENLLKTFIGIHLVGATIFTGTLFGLDHFYQLSLELISLINVFSLSFIFLLKIYFLARNNIEFKGLTRVHLASTLLLICLLLLL